MFRLSRRYLIAAFVILGLGAFVTVQAAEGTDVIGQVSKIQKAVFAMQDALPRKLEVGSDVLLGDVISTGKGARIEIILSDGAEVTLGERTHFVVQEFLAGADENNAVMRLLEGAFKVTSGKMMEVADASFVVETNTATIGIRGTTFWGGSLDGGFEVALLDGKGVFVETRAGRVDLTEIGQGTKVTGAAKSPSKPTSWPQKKVNRAIATITFDK